MDSLLDDDTSSAGGLVQSGTAIKLTEDEECQHHAIMNTDAMAAAATKIAISKDKGGNLKPYIS